MEIIKTQNLTFTYPDCSSPALESISLSVNKGEFITVCGASGCGKSTLLRHLKPTLAPHGELDGDIFFNGTQLNELDNRTIASAIGFVGQNPELQIVTDKVYHELAFGLESLGYDNNTIRFRVAEVSSFFGIGDWFHKNTSELSGGQKQILNLASVMAMRPDVLLLDEPTSQLDPIAAQKFVDMLSRINRELGVTVILTEHRLEETFAVSDKVAAMDNGKIIVIGTPEQVGRKLSELSHPMFSAMPTPLRVHFSVPNDELCPITVGEGKLWLENMDKKISIDKSEKILPERNDKETVIELSDVWFRYEKNTSDVLRGLNLNVSKGEFYAILGGNGAGKTTALSVIGSYLKPYRGKVKVSGKVSALPQDPRTLFTRKTVSEELYEVNENVSDIIDLCDIGNILDKHPFDISGGEQQRVALAKVLLTNPDILLLDEPTKGFDARFKERFGSIIKSLTSNGVTVVAVSHDMEFCARWADRCAMFFDGRVVSEDVPYKFFSDNSFYTTSASRMANGIIPDAVTAEDIITACGGKISPREDVNIKKHNEPQRKTKPSQKRKIHLIPGLIFFALFCVAQIMFGDRYSGWKDVTAKIFTMVLLGLSLVNLIPQKPIAVTFHEKRQKFSIGSILSLVMILIVAPVTVLVGVYSFGDRKYLFISLLIILETIIPFMLMFEKRHPKAREIIIISVLCAIGVIGRQAFFMLPQFKPVLAIVIISGICFGCETGFLVGSVTAFASNFITAQGPWTPWQMFAMGLIGFLAGIVFRKGILPNTRISVCVFGAFSALLIYGGIMDFGSVVMWNPNPTKELILASYVAGSYFNVIHAVSTMFFLWFLAPAMVEKLHRVKQKYGLI